MKRTTMAMFLGLFLASAAWAQTDPPKAALFRGAMPGAEAGVVAALDKALTDAGYAVAELGADALCDAAQLRAEAFDLLVLANGAALPVSSVASVKAYLEGGGNIIALKAPLWRDLLLHIDGEWVTRDAYERAHAAALPDHVLFDFARDDIAVWQRGHFPEDIGAVYETVGEGPAPGRRSLHARLDDLRNWDNFGPPVVEAPFPKGHTLTVFSAKGGPETRSLSVEWEEKDGSRWIATVPLDTTWRQYMLAPEQFKFWQSVPERAKDVFRPENALRFQIGLAFTHTGTTPGPQEWWVSAFGTAEMIHEHQQVLARPDLPRMDLLSPAYKFFDCTDVARLEPRNDQVLINPESNIQNPTSLRSPQPRPGGGGFSKGRVWRWVPLVEAYSADGEWRGAPVALMAHSGGPFQGGQWASFGVDDAAWFQTPEAQGMVRQIAQKMRDGVYIMDGGASFYTYFEDQSIRLGLRVANLGREAQTGLIADMLLIDPKTGDVAVSKTWPLSLAPGQEKEVEGTWRPDHWPEGGFRAEVRVLDGTRVIDQVEHEVHVWKPKANKSFLTAKDGDFIVDGERWRAHGVNYMPSSGIGTEDGDYFEHWIGARAYDPEIIQRDLDHCKDLGLNSVSIFIYRQSMEAHNLLDILRRCELLGMKVNLSLRPGTPVDFLWDEMRAMIEHYRLWDNDTVYAYDLAWEPLWWGHDKRQRWDEDWGAWIVERYGDLENAERDWGFPVPRDAEGGVTNPSAEQVEGDGEWRRMVAAYRRFLDTVLYKYYSRARTLVRSVDPNHLVSFRMTEAGDPTMSWHGVMPYDFPYLAAAVDLLEPEGYGRIGDWERVKPGWFEYEYARWAAPDMPCMWAEAGVHAWDIGVGRCTADKLAFQGEYYGHFYRMLIGSGADGVYWWWYPGGFRTNENSDYGIINPDGSDRPNSTAIREHADAFINGADAKPVDYWIEIDREARADGVVGIYKTVQDEFWKAVEDGHTPGLRTAGTGTTSANCPLLAVGNTPCNGTNPPKFLDGFFDSLEVRDPNGDWVAVDRAARVEVAPDRPVIARVQLTNLGEATWLCQGDGAVYVTALERTPLPADVLPRRSVTVSDVILAPAGLRQPTEVTVSLVADGRTAFGEKYCITLARSDPSDVSDKSDRLGKTDNP